MGCCWAGTSARAGKAERWKHFPRHHAGSMLAAPSVPHCPSILVCSWVLAACVWCLLLKTGVRVCTVGPARTLRCLAAWMVPLPRAGWLGRAVGVLRVLVSLCLSLLTSCPCPAPGARAVACRLGWSHGTAEPAMVEAPGPSPLPHGEHEHRVSQGGMDAAGAVQPVPVLPASPMAHLGPALQIQPCR